MVFRRIIKASAIYGGADFFTKAISFFTFPIVANMLSKHEFGTLELIYTVITILTLIINCGINNATQRHYWDNGTSDLERKIIVTTGLFAQILFGLILLLLSYFLIEDIVSFFQKVDAYVTHDIIFSCLIYSILNMWVQYSMDVVRLQFKPWIFFIIALMSRVGTVCTGLYALIALNLGMGGMLKYQCYSLVIMMPFIFLAIKDHISFKFFQKKFFYSLVKYGHAFIYVGLAYWIFGSTDKWLLAKMTNVEEVGVFSVAYKFASVVIFVSNAFGQAWSPIAIKMRTDNPLIYRKMYGDVLLVVIFIMFLVGNVLSLFSGEIVSFLMGSTYANSVPSIIILAIGIAIQATQQVTAVGISIERKTYLFARLAWGGAALNAVFNILLIPEFGALGSAIATLITYICLSGGFLFYTQILHPINIDWTRFFMLILWATAFSLIAFIFIDVKIDPMLVSLKLFILAAFAVSGFFLLNERKFLKKLTIKLSE